MRILAVSDVVDPVLYDYFDVGRWRDAGVDVLVSCGDVPPDYLSLLRSRFDRPLLYVLGNHDGSYYFNAPEGCESVDGRLIRWNGIRILGLGGAPWYNGGTEQYRERAMALRIALLKPRIWRMGGVDLVVAHAPPRFPPSEAAPAERGLTGEARAGATAARDPGHSSAAPSDPGHRGFRAFAGLVRAYHPRVFLHGHTHLGYGTTDRVGEVQGTRIVDAYGHALVDL